MTTVYINNVGLIGEMKNMIFAKWKEFANEHEQTHMYACYKMHGDKRKNYNIFNCNKWTAKDYEFFISNGFKGMREYYVGNKYETINTIDEKECIAHYGTE